MDEIAIGMLVEIERLVERLEAASQENMEQAWARNDAHSLGIGANLADEAAHAISMLSNQSRRRGDRVRELTAERDLAKATTECYADEQRKQLQDLKATESARDLLAQERDALKATLTEEFRVSASRAAEVGRLRKALGIAHQSIFSGCDTVRALAAIDAALATPSSHGAGG